MSSPDPATFANAVLASLGDSSDDALIVTDLDATVLSWSPGATRLYGYTADEMIGRSLAVLWPESQAGVFPSHFRRLREGHRVEQFETVRVAKGSRFIQVAVTLSPVRDDSGAVIAALSLARDIRGQKRREEALSSSQARWRALLDSAVDGIVVIDERGRIEAFNPAAERLFGYTEGELLGKNVNVLMPSPYHEEHDGYLARYLREGAARIIGKGREVTGRRRDASTFPVHLSVGEMSLDGQRRFTGILHDLSNRTKLEEQLREQEALARLGEMAAVIAHEVKNPLAGIRGAIQVIANRLPADSPERGVTKEVVARLDALSELMSDMLLFARPPKPNLVPVAVRPLISATVELLAADPALNAVSIRVEGDAPPVSADAGLLKIVIQNLIVNSAQAVQGQGSILVSVSARDGACSITVRDDGPGIPSDVREKIFMPFFTTKSRGTGLGLPTCKQLIEAHRGNIGVTCPPEGGTVVSIELPLQP